MIWKTDLSEKNVSKDILEKPPRNLPNILRNYI